MRRRQFIRFVGGAVAAWPFTAHAQSTKMPQIGVLSLGRGDKSDGSLSTINAFMPALRELGYTEGLNIAFERKFADGDAKKLSGLAQELVDRRVDAIVAFATPAARADDARWRRLSASRQSIGPKRTSLVVGTCPLSGSKQTLHSRCKMTAHDAAAGSLSYQGARRTRFASR